MARFGKGNPHRDARTPNPDWGAHTLSREIPVNVGLLSCAGKSVNDDDMQHAEDEQGIAERNMREQP